MLFQLRELGSKCFGMQGRKSMVDWRAQRTFGRYLSAVCPIPHRGEGAEVSGMASTPV